MRILKRVFKIFLTAFLFFSIVGVLLFLFQARKYHRWEEEQFKQENSLVCLTTIYDDYDQISKEEMEEEVAEKIKTFTLSDSRTDFVVLTKKEVLHVLSSNIQTVEPFAVEDVCLVPSLGVWEVYIKYEVGEFSLPWVVMDVVKENRETAELYITDIRVGGSQIPGVLKRNIIVEVNRGISDAVIMLNENRFLGRVIENIELLEDRVVFKGSV